MDRVGRVQFGEEVEAPVEKKRVSALHAWSQQTLQSDGRGCWPGPMFLCPGGAPQLNPDSGRTCTVATAIKASRLLSHNYCLLVGHSAKQPMYRLKIVLAHSVKGRRKRKLLLGEQRTKWELWGYTAVKKRLYSNVLRTLLSLLCGLLLCLDMVSGSCLDFKTQNAKFL